MPKPMPGTYSDLGKCVKFAFNVVGSRSQDNYKKAGISQERKKNEENGKRRRKKVNKKVQGICQRENKTTKKKNE